MTLRATAANLDVAGAPRPEKIETDDRDHHHSGGRDRVFGNRIHVGDPPRRPPGPGAVGSREAGLERRRGHGPEAAFGPSSIHDRTVLKVFVFRVIGKPPEARGVRRRRGPRARHARRNEVGIGPCRRERRAPGRSHRSEDRGTCEARRLPDARRKAGESRARAGPDRGPRSSASGAGFSSSCENVQIRLPHAPPVSFVVAGVDEEPVTTRPQSGPGRGACGRFCQIASSACCVASSASSTSRRIHVRRREDGRRSEGEDRERLPVAALRPDHELSIHPLSPMSSPEWTALLQGYDRPRRRSSQPLTKSRRSEKKPVWIWVTGRARAACSGLGAR